jgi:drug/metabolite transporter (DMT)-like permease
MVAVALALAASGCWGVADFTGGLKSKRVAIPLVLFVVEGAGLAGVLVVIALSGEPLPGSRAVIASLVAGVAGIGSLGLFYRALAIGTMSIVAPISASGVALPVVVGIATGDSLSVVVSAGLAITVAGIVLASRESPEAEPQDARARRTSVVLALLAAAGFGTYFVLSDVASDYSVLWLLALSRVIVVPAMAGVVLASRARAGGSDLLTLVGAGLLDVAATGLYGLALTKGELSIVSVVGALYPVSTVLLARVVLGERLRPVQAAGVAAAFTGVALIVAG